MAYEPSDMWSHAAASDRHDRPQQIHSSLTAPAAGHRIQPHNPVPPKDTNSNSREERPGGTRRAAAALCSRMLRPLAPRVFAGFVSSNTDPWKETKACGNETARR